MASIHRGQQHSGKLTLCVLNPSRQHNARAALVGRHQQAGAEEFQSRIVTHADEILTAHGLQQLRMSARLVDQLAAYIHQAQVIGKACQRQSLLQCMFRHQAGVGWHRIMAQADRIQSWRHTAQSHVDFTDTGQQPRLQQGGKVAGFLPGQVFLLAAGIHQLHGEKSTQHPGQQQGQQGHPVAASRHSARQGGQRGKLEHKAWRALE